MAFVARGGSLVGRDQHYNTQIKSKPLNATLNKLITATQIDNSEQKAGVAMSSNIALEAL